VDPWSNLCEVCGSAALCLAATREHVLAEQGLVSHIELEVKPNHQDVPQEGLLG